jgi:small subunit ribosomal protein S6
MAQYEVTLLLPQEVKDGKKIADKLCKAADVKVVKTHDLKVQELAYPIARQTQAHYWRFEIEAAPQQIVDLEKRIKLEESIMRFLIVGA